jgi:hypothetical protein
MDRLTGDVIFGAKLLSVFASIGVIALICWAALSRMGNGLQPYERLWLAIAATLLLLFDPLFLFTSGRTWNHELAAFFLAAALVFHVESFRSRPLLCSGLSGCALGFAAGTNLGYATAAVAFIAHLLISGSETWPRRLRLIAVWILGASVALIPCLYFLASSPEAFLSEILAPLEPGDTRLPMAAPIWWKIRFLLQQVALPSWPMVGLFVALGAVPFVQAVKYRRFSGGAVFSLLLSLSVIAGCVAQGYRYPHFFALVVVGAFGIIYRCKESLVSAPVRRTALALLSVLAIGSALGWFPVNRIKPQGAGWQAYLTARAMRDPSLWFCHRFRQQHAVLLRYIPAGEHVLTLAPTGVVAANRKIYPPFATGIAMWRRANGLDPEQRKRLKYVGSEDLIAFLEGHPPAAILTGVAEIEYEKEFIIFAETEGFTKVELPKQQVLWLAPKRVGE